MDTNLNAELLRAILSGEYGQDGYFYNPTSEAVGGSVESGGGYQAMPNSGSISRRAGGRNIDSWDVSGNYMGQTRDNKFTNEQIALIAALTFAGGSAAGSALGGGAAAGGAAGGTAAAGGAAELGAGGSWLGGGGGLESLALGGSDAALGAGTAFGGGSLGGGSLGAGAAGGEAFGAGLGATDLSWLGGTEGLGNAAALGGASSGLTTAGGGSAGLTAGSGLDWGKTASQLLGGVAGAASARDQTQSTNRDPWGPAQPLLMDIINSTRGLHQQYQAQPFSDAQKTAYGNQAGLLNAINQASPGLLAGMNANSSGANSYDRANPRRQLTGSSTNLNWSPWLLSLFGGK